MVELTVGSGFGFRTEQNMVTQLDNGGARIDSTFGTGTVTVCNFTVQ